MEDRIMKKTYIAPVMETCRLQTTGMLLGTSSLTPEEWDGGGVGGSRVIEIDELDMLMRENVLM